MNQIVCRALIALTLPWAASCSVGLGGEEGTSGDDSVSQPTPPPGFNFATSETETLTVSVTIDGVAAPGVNVQVTSPRDTFGDGEGDSAARVLYVGATDSSGQASGEIVIPSEYDGVDLIVHRAGTSGPYTDESLRSTLGPVAPSARVRVSRTALGFQFVALTTNS